MQRKTQVLVEVQTLFCAQPSFGNFTRVGVTIPTAARVMSVELSIMDNDHGWSGYESGQHPNINCRREDFNDLNDLKFVGFAVDNRDENLRRYLHATVTWEGEGEDIAQSEVMTLHGCNKAREDSNASADTRIVVKAGLLIPNGATLAEPNVEVRESNGPWSAKAPPNLTIRGLSSQAAPPGLNGVTWAVVQVENQDRVSARALRIRGTIR